MSLVNSLRVGVITALFELQLLGEVDEVVDECRLGQRGPKETEGCVERKLVESEHVKVEKRLNNRKEGKSGVNMVKDE